MSNHQLTKTWGDTGAPSVILIHGLTGRGSLWTEVATRLAQAGYHVWAPDLRGHGNNHSDGHSLADMVDDISNMLEQTGPAAVVGHSLGAVVGWQVAVARPQQVKCLVIEDQPPDRQASSAGGWRDWANAWPRTFESRTEAMEFLEFAGRSMAWWEPSLQPGPVGAWGWAFDFVAIPEIAQELADRDSWDDLKALTIPTLIVRGALSPHLRPAVAQRMAEVIPDARLVTVVGADHWVHRDATRYSDLLLHFFGQTKAGGVTAGEIDQRTGGS